MVSGGFGVMDLIDPNGALQAARDYVDSIAETFDEDGVSPREVVAATGSAASGILEFARENDVDLIAPT